MDATTRDSRPTLPDELTPSAPAAADQAAAREDRILRVWTPLLLRLILSASVALLSAGLIASEIQWSGRHSDASAIAPNASIGSATTHSLIAAASLGSGAAIATLGLFVLTLVPLARVAFCFILFVKQRSIVFAGFTAYVLAGLIAGILLGRIG
jgi:uncharacterized membrane protein